ERGPVTVVVASATVAHQRFDHLVPDGTEIELRLSARTKLRGRVVDSSGRPVAEAWCAALRGFDYLAAFGTDAQGRFETELPVVAGTTFQLTARFPRDENASTSRGVLDDVPAGPFEPT